MSYHLIRRIRWEYGDRYAGTSLCKIEHPIDVAEEDRIFPSQWDFQVRIFPIVLHVLYVIGEEIRIALGLYKLQLSFSISLQKVFG